MKKLILVGMLALATSAAAAAVNPEMTKKYEASLSAFKKDGPNLCDKYAVALGDSFDAYTRGWVFDGPRFMAEKLASNHMTTDEFTDYIKVQEISEEYSTQSLVLGKNSKQAGMLIFDQVEPHKTEFCLISWTRKSD